MENRLMTIMFLDMQGYTKRSARQTIDEMKIFHDQMFKFVTDIVDKWNGIMVKSMGDGFLVRFESPTNAVQAGIEIQRKLEARNAQMMHPESLVRFRVGINTGEVGVDENGDLFGDPVNIASRIQTYADTNDVFISESTYLAMNQNEFGAVDLGSQELKNATREIRIYKVLKSGMPVSSGHGNDNWFKRNKKLSLAVIVLLALLFGSFIVRRAVIKRRIAQQDQKAVQNVQNGQNEESVHNDGGKVASAAKDAQTDADADNQLLTIVDLKPADNRLQFDPQEQRAFSEFKKNFKQQHYDICEKIAVNMIRTRPEIKKVPWALLLAENFFIQGDKENAARICDNLTKTTAKIPQVHGKVKNQIGKMKKKYL
ncbi:MAG: adenylate/guanylate cyclase domain-containing protein [Candidatus Rifleibacteriota bacterium]